MRRESFSKDLLFIFVICVTIPLILLSIAQAAYFNNKFIKETEKQFDNTLYSVSKNLQIYLDELKYLSLSPLLNNDLLHNMIFINQNNYKNIGEVQYGFQNLNSFSKIMQKLLCTSRNNTKGVVFIPTLGNTCYFVNRFKASTKEIEGEVYSKEELLKAIEANGTAIPTKIHKASYFDDQPVFSVLRLIKDIDTKRNIGILKVDASSAFIEDIFTNITISENSVLMLVDGGFDIVYSSNPQKQDLLKEFGTAVKNIKYKKDTYYVTSADVPSTSWKLIYFTSKNDVVEHTNTIFYYTFLCFLISLLLAYLLFKLNSKKVVSNVKVIINGMQEIEKGNLKAKIEMNPNFNDDFNKIAKAFNVMTDELELHIYKEYRATLSQKAAEYRALQSQINPHFLYNVLNGFIALNRLEYRDVLEESIIRLTKLFRYSCNNSSITTVQEEMNFIEQYFFLQKLRFEERLQYLITIDPAAQQIPIPKLLIQPLAENAIIHGIEPYDHAVLIEIAGFVFPVKGLGDYLILLVRDNGIGFDQSGLDINSSVGLKNTQERLKFFKENSVFAITSSPESGTTCFIAIKIEKE